MNIIKYIFISAITLTILIQNVYAASTCQLPAGSPATYNVPLAPQNITVGPDMPDGTIVYRVNFNHPTTFGFSCTTPPGESFNLPQRLDYSSLPLPLSGWNGAPFPGKVYLTSVPGIGVAVWNDLSNQALPTVAFTTTFTNPGNAPVFNFHVRINTVLSFIKIGPVSPGVISASSLPSVYLEFASDPSVSNTPLRIYNLNFTGSINVVSQTCTTPDVDVPLGIHDVSKFTGIGSTTSWVDSSIVLKDCPRFYGYFNNTNYNNSSGAGSTTVGTAVANVLSLKLSPQTAILDVPHGIMSLASNPRSAEGVGIQLGWGDSTGTPALFDFSKSYNYTPGDNMQTSFKIPLAARYIQTESSVSPGIADGKVTFTINYY